MHNPQYKTDKTNLVNDIKLLYFTDTDQSTTYFFKTVRLVFHFSAEIVQIFIHPQNQTRN